MLIRGFVVLMTAACVQLMAFNAFAQEQTGEIRTVQPEVPGQRGFELSAGTALGLGLGTDNVMYVVHAGLETALNDRLQGKLFGEATLGTSSDSAQIINFGLGGDLLLEEMRISYGVPFAALNLGYGFARHNDDDTSEGVSVGAGIGFKLATQSLDWDLGIHYSLVTEDIDGTLPSAVSLRIGANF